MKLKKRYLSLILLMSITSSILTGCGNQKTPYDKMVESTNSTNENVENIEDVDENLNATDEDVDVKMIDKKEALELATKEVHKVFPDAKLKNESDKYKNSDGFYAIKYDVPYCTTVRFTVDPYTGDVQAHDLNTKEYLDMDEWATNINRYFDKTVYEQKTGQETMSKFVSEYNNNQSAENMAWAHLSDSQLNSFELVSNELVEFRPGMCGWVFRYPMETEHVVYEETDRVDCTRRNAVSKDDKYAYIMVDPISVKSKDKTSTYYGHVCDWGQDDFYWEGFPEDE